MATYLGNPNLVNGSNSVTELCNVLAAAGLAELDDTDNTVVVVSATLDRTFTATYDEATEQVTLYDDDTGDVNFFSMAEAGEYVVFGNVTPD